MAHTFSTQKEPQFLLEQLINRLFEKDPEAAARLRRLKEAVESGPSSLAEAWAASDLHTMIDPEGIVERFRTQNVYLREIGLLEIGRNMLVLLPLLLTWFAISKATEGYESLIHANPSSISQPFLYLWQQGFYQHLPWGGMTLSVLALIDSILLFLILFLTGIISWLSGLRNLQKERDAEKLHADLSMALVETKLRLFHLTKQQQPKSFTDVVEHLDSIAEQFKQTTQQFMQELQEERKSRGDLSSFTTALTGIAQGMSAAADSIKQTNEGLTTSVSELSTIARDIPGHQQELILAARETTSQLNTVTRSMEQLVNDQVRWSQEIQHTLATSLQQLIAEQATQGRTLYHMLQTLLMQLVTNQEKAWQELRQQLDSALSKVVNGQESSSQELQRFMERFVTRQERVSQDIQDVLESLETTLQKHIIPLVASQSDFMQTLDDQQKLQSQLTYQAATATNGMGNSLAAINECGKSLRSIAQDMNNFLQNLHALPTVIKVELLDSLKQYSSAAANVSAGASTLDAAATAIYQASKKLEDAVVKLNGRLGV